MKILITGGMGMIGSCLAAHSLRQGHTVTVYDNEETGSVENLSYHLSPDELSQIRCLRGDVLDQPALRQAVFQADLCYHMAATLGTIKVVHRPRHMLRVNVVGTQNIIDLCLERQIPVVVASTSMVYGNNPAPVVREEDDLFIEGDLRKGLWWYAVSKMADEAYARAAMLEDPGAKIMIVRPFNVVAPLQKGLDGFVLPRFIRAALRDEPLLVYGDGSQQRTFLWVSDFVDALLEVVAKDAWNDTINIGCTEEISIFELANLVIKMSGSRSEIQLMEPQLLFRNQFVEIQRRVPELARLQQLIGRRTFTPIEEIVQRFLDFHHQV